ncbi:mucosal addressin cell adhesion molecule 1 [Elgaria multicarinata webbii]|uniref:mucosal addressin cell adhesion molecule 1 n=1 Tax=Elgaria multicarinata webbii TaxID=159646 RepID=UPI002FCCF88B
MGELGLPYQIPECLLSSQEDDGGGNGSSSQPCQGWDDLSLSFNAKWMLTASDVNRSKPASFQLTVRPLKPLVERGGSVQLTCSMDCPGGKLQWVGLDTDLGDVASNHTYSVLTVANATISMEGVKMCTGQCQGQDRQAKVLLKVYSFPDTLRLDSEPKAVTGGRPARLTCSMSYIYPLDTFTMSWFRGGERLDASDETAQEMEEAQEQLFEYRSVLEVPEAPAGAEYKCQATLRAGGQTFQRVALVGTQATTEIPAAVNETARTSHVATPEPLTTESQDSSFVGTTTGLPHLLSTKRPTPGVSTAMVASTRTLESLAKTDSPTAVANASSGSLYPTVAEIWTSSSKAQPKTSPPVAQTPAKFGVTSQVPSTTDQRFTMEPISTKDYRSSEAVPEKPPGSTPREDPCRPMITPVPSQGIAGEALRITCRTVGCSAGVQIRWVHTPVEQSRYGREEEDGTSVLVVESVTMEHQGVYRCAMMSAQPQIASLQVVVSAASFSTDSLITIGTAGSLLGLMITGYVSHRLRRRRGG